ncbi:hypothetical protein RRG08_061251 [Elysia crispata]|uniref:Uncharacterized protein n=1 Tax=Elysia crispata TaxID=231223 RepID=A0AAE0ZI41_9GAST|nr:hypothetical protein RRG08_061251 [Elysia crispata]
MVWLEINGKLNVDLSERRGQRVTNGRKANPPTDRDPRLPGLHAERQRAHQGAQQQPPVPPLLLPQQRRLGDQMAADLQEAPQGQKHSAPIHGSPPVCKLTHSIVRFFIALFPILPTVYFVDMCPNLTSSLSFRFFLQCILSICAQISLHRSLSDSPYSVFCRYVPKSHFIALFPILPTVYFVDMCPNLTSSLSFRFSLQCILSICAQISLHRSLSDSPYSVFCRYVPKSHFIALFPILPTVYFVDMCPNLTSSLSFRFSLQCILSICAQISLHRSLSDSSYSVFCRYVPKSHFIALFPILPTVYFVDMCPNLTSSLSFRFFLQCILSICAQISLHRSLSDSSYSVFCRYVPKSHFIGLFPILPTVYFVDMCPNLTSSLSFRFSLQCILSICAQISLHRSLSDSSYSVFCRYVPKSHFIGLFPILPTVYFVDMCPNLGSPPRDPFFFYPTSSSILKN